jgi:hypothetical protein
VSGRKISHDEAAGDLDRHDLPGAVELPGKGTACDGIEVQDAPVALIKRDLGESGAVAAWRERLGWVTSSRQPIDFHCDPLPLAVFEQGCVYRERAIHTLESAGRAWRIAYMSPSILGIQTAVSAGLGVSIFNGPHRHHGDRCWSIHRIRMRRERV